MNISQFLSLFETQMQDQEYEGASRTLKQLQVLGMEEPQLQLLTARIYECTNRTAEAEQLYRQVLKSSASNSIINQARQGLQVIQDQERQKREARIALEMTEEESKDHSLLLLLPIAVSDREQKAEGLARIFNLDIYTARSVLPTKHLKIYRLGRYGEMKVYAEELKKYGIESLPIRLKTIESISVYPVIYLEEDKEGINITTKDKDFYVPWQLLTRMVKGQVPIIEEVVIGVDKKYQIAKAEQTKDFLSIVDLHCPQQQMIFRLQDQQYQFIQGKRFIGDNITMMARWKELIAWLEQTGNFAIADDFLPFAEMALLYPETLQEITPKVNFARVKECLWDNSFHLYSCIFFGR